MSRNLLLAAFAAITLTAPTLAAGGPNAGGTTADVEKDGGWHPHIEASPVFLLLKGFGLEGGVRLTRRLELSAAIFTLDIPELLQRENKDEGWDIRDTGGGITLRYFFRGDGRGLFVGGLVESQNHHLERASTSKDVVELGVGGQVGYQWFPVDGSDFFVRPWLLVVAPLYETDDRELAGETLDEPPVRFVPSAYVGMEF